MVMNKIFLINGNEQNNDNKLMVIKKTFLTFGVEKM